MLCYVFEHGILADKKTRIKLFIIFVLAVKKNKF